MAKHKFASNVIEKCWLHSGPAERAYLIDIMIGREGMASPDPVATAAAAVSSSSPPSAALQAPLSPVSASSASARSPGSPEGSLHGSTTSGGSASGSISSSSSPFLQLVKDAYANFCVQLMLEESSESERATIIARIRRYGNTLRKIPYGKHIIARIEKVTGAPFNV
jgi:hypothetical protein